MQTFKFALALGIACFTGTNAYAKPDTVPGAACTACHKAKPPTKTNLTATAANCLANFKDSAKCKECHTKGAHGKLARKKTPSE